MGRWVIKGKGEEMTTLPLIGWNERILIIWGALGRRIVMSREQKMMTAMKFFQQAQIRWKLIFFFKNTQVFLKMQAILYYVKMHLKLYETSRTPF